MSGPRRTAAGVARPFRARDIDNPAGESHFGTPVDPGEHSAGGLLQGAGANRVDRVVEAGEPQRSGEPHASRIRRGNAGFFVHVDWHGGARVRVEFEAVTLRSLEWDRQAELRSKGSCPDARG